MYEVAIYTVLDSIEGEIHMMSQVDIKTYEEAVAAAARMESLGFRAEIKETEAA